MILWNLVDNPFAIGYNFKKDATHLRHNGGFAVKIYNKVKDMEFLKIAGNQLASLKRRLEEIDDSIEALQVERNDLTDKTSALEKVLDAWMPDPNGRSTETVEESGMRRNPESTNQERRVGRFNPADLAEKILSDRDGEPMHYRELANEVFDQGGDLPEGSRGATLNALMNQDVRFIRPLRRGYYALKKDHPNVKRSVGSRRRRRDSAS